MRREPAPEGYPVLSRLEDFDPQSGSRIERLIFNHRLIVLILCLLALAVLGARATRLTFNASFENMLPLGHPYIANYLAHREELSGLGNTMRIAVETTQGTILDANYIETLRRINDEVFLLPGVDRPYMKSLWTPSVRWVAVTEEGLEGGTVIPDTYDGSAASIAQVRANIERSGEIGRLVAANYRSTVIAAPLLEKDYTAGQALDYGKLSDALEWQLQQLASVISTQSFAGLSKWLSVGMNEGNPKWYDLPRNQDMLNAFAGRAPRELISQNCDLLPLYVYLQDHKADTLARVTADVERFAEKTKSNDATFLLAAGNAGIEAATNAVVKRSHLPMLALVYAAAIVLCFITFRSWRAVFCAIVPLVLAAILCEALMVMLGIGVKVATLPVIALGVGIGVDYGLYVLAVLLARLRAGMSLQDAYAATMRFTGRVVMFTGFTLAIATGIRIFSPIKFQADMGILLAFMFLWNLLGALVLLPALAVFLLGKEGIGEKTLQASNPNAYLLSRKAK